MSPNPPREPLDDVLRQWQIRPSRDPNLRVAVVHRLERAARLTWSAYIRDHLVGWSIAAMVALVAAGWGGRAMARSQVDASRDAMVVSYLSSLDPRIITQLRP